jgi:membrane protease YdiL (CAAX protease family)
MTIANLDLFTLAMLGYFVILGPWLARRELAKLRRDAARGFAHARLRIYRQTIGMEWGLTAVFVAWWLLSGRTLADMGLQFPMAGWQWIALAVSVVATLLFVFYTHRAGRNAKSLAEVRAQLGSLTAMAPHTPTELRRFTWLSLTAGICEEVLYRGLLMTSLAAVTGLWPAVVLSSVVFGIGHAYQGKVGVLRTGLVGLVMALVVVFTGSLPLAMVIHAVVDIAQGRLLWAAVNSGPDGSMRPAESVPSPA